jgi:ABC-type phosphate transport system substrate-binding protein
MSFRRYGRLAVIGLMLAGVSNAEESFKVIVNKSNPGGRINREALQTIFLKTGARWGNGHLVEGVDQSTRSAVRAAFAEHVLGHSLQAVEAEWTQSILQGKGVPPPVRPSDEEVVAYVKARPDAIGYVSPTLTLDPGVKVLQVIE